MFRGLTKFDSVLGRMVNTGASKSAEETTSLIQPTHVVCNVRIEKVASPGLMFGD